MNQHGIHHRFADFTARIAGLSESERVNRLLFAALDTQSDGVIKDRTMALRAAWELSKRFHLPWQPLGQIAWKATPPILPHHLRNVPPDAGPACAILPLIQTSEPETSDLQIRILREILMEEAVRMPSGLRWALQFSTGMSAPNVQAAIASIHEDILSDVQQPTRADPPFRFTRL